MRKTSVLILAVVAAVMPSPAFSLDVGEQAPDFLGKSTGGEVQLADFRGEKSVVLALYFAAFTPV